MQKDYDFMFVCAMPPLISYPAGGLNIIYKICGHLSSKGYKVAIFHIREPKQSPMARLMIESAFSSYSVLSTFQKIARMDYDYSVLRNVDILFSDSLPTVNAKKIFVTDWRYSKAVSEYLKAHSGSTGYQLIQNFEDDPLYSKDAEAVHQAFGIANLKKVVTSMPLYERYKADSPLYFNMAIDELFMKPYRPRQEKVQTIMMPLRDHASKGSAYALEMADRIKKGGDPNVRFVAYGNMDKKSVPDYISYYYKPKNSLLAKLYYEADIFVYPSLIEGFASPPIEAMASGCATVIADSLGIREYAKDGVNSIIVPIKDSNALYEAVKRILSDAKLENALSMNGVETGKRFGYSTMYANFDKAFGI